MPTTLTLTQLLRPWLELGDELAIPVRQLELDSRQVTNGSTFVAIQGHALDARKFIPAAIAQGANAVIAQACSRAPHGLVEYIQSVPVVYVDALDQRLSQLALSLYPVAGNHLIGVTGTNGKTTVTQLIAQWLELLGQRAAVLGTAGNGFLENLQPAVNTTGSAVTICQMLSQLQQRGAHYTAMEISSHGLVQGRVKALPFAAGVFTNLSRDHLDYHGTMDEYARAKQMLFTDHACQHAIINADDAVGAQWLTQLDHATAVSLSPTTHKRAVFAHHVLYSEQGIELHFDGLYGQGELQVPLIGQFNASNVLVAMTTLLELGFDKSALMATAPQLEPVIGRMELFASPGKAKVVVDYAHTPDALEKALQALRVHCHGKLWAIFGCGGDRDTGKRPMMASIGEQLADQVILADDNPRSEDPKAIVQDMLDGMAKPNLAIVEHDRYQALRYALVNSQAQDIILLAGKGHEDYQVLADKTVHYSDRESAAELLESPL
ncbi:UDP-N-acetylmuramoyl-L-alanyl-D-glutamate--2,6-diaminopimelate ligase [Vibrio cholerae]